MEVDAERLETEKPESGFEGFGDDYGAEHAFGLVDGLDVFVGGIGIGHHVGLDVDFSILEETGAQGDAGIVRSIEAEIAPLSPAFR